MRLLLDTHIVLGILDETLDSDHPGLSVVVNSMGHALVVSVASLWEIAIKARLGKLEPPVPPERLEEFLMVSGLEILPVKASHATVRLDADVSTRDPFDRLLVATAQIEGLKLVTADRALAGHPLTIR